MAIRPGGEYAGRPLHIVWLLDCSGSMAEGGKIEALNNAIREVIPAMKKAAEGNPEVQFFIRAMRFSSGAAWHEARPTPLGEFKWVDLQAEGETDIGGAVAQVYREQPDRHGCFRDDHPHRGVCWRDRIPRSAQAAIRRTGP